MHILVLRLLVDLLLLKLYFSAPLFLPQPFHHLSLLILFMTLPPDFSLSIPVSIESVYKPFSNIKLALTYPLLIKLLAPRTALSHKVSVYQIVHPHWLPMSSLRHHSYLYAQLLKLTDFNSYKPSLEWLLSL